MCYGAQIGPDWDRRIYDTYVEELFQPRLLALPTGSPSTHGWFRLPRDGTYQTYVDFIAGQLPDRDGIEVFGQHENANIKYLASRSGYMLQMLARLATVAAVAPTHPQQQRQTGQDSGRSTHAREGQTSRGLVVVLLEPRTLLKMVLSFAPQTLRVAVLSLFVSFILSFPFPDLYVHRGFTCLDCPDKASNLGSAIDTSCLPEPRECTADCGLRCKHPYPDLRRLAGRGTLLQLPPGPGALGCQLCSADAFGSNGRPFRPLVPAH
uniref:Dynein heavy chain AAA lid domain-containing protein n=1 Tax=Anopheles atroparvus TaxID=41427 RepID=A0AAG5CXL4_ANOAO